MNQFVHPVATLDVPRSRLLLQLLVVQVQLLVINVVVRLHDVASAHAGLQRWAHGYDALCGCSGRCSWRCGIGAGSTSKGDDGTATLRLGCLLLELGRASSSCST